MQLHHKRSFAAEELARQKKKKPRLWLVVASLVFALVISGYALYYMKARQKQAETETKQIKSLSVNNIAFF